ncbi:MAG: ribosome silencing factor [Ruminococcaceae bacterium]|nr:ribosome silencing factor [Oscillospiraceae bacterium]
MEDLRHDPKALAEKVVTILDMKKAGGIKLLHVADKTVLADYFVICTGNSNTQTRALGDEVEYKLGLEGIEPARVEGRESALWVLLDYSSVLVHVFHTEARQYYNLEKLWNEAEEVDISHLLTED